MWETNLLKEGKKNAESFTKCVFQAAAATIGRITLTAFKAEVNCFDKAQVRWILWAACQAGLAPWQIIKANW